jgi:hypothetical protein
MYGVVTRNAEELTWAEFDRGFYEVKDVTGRQVDPEPEAVNMISCFGDNAAEGEPELLPVDDAGTPATRDREFFDWSYVCPTHEDYREGLLTIIEEAAAVSGDIRLDDVGFPRAAYCHCERCNERFAASDHEDRMDWRASVITEFVAAARERVPGKLYLTLYPDPHPGHLFERAGIGLDELATDVDEFVVPIYDMAYSTTYWLEIIASGFADRLSTPYSIELYAVHLDVENLVDAAEVAGAYGDSVIFGYDASNARAAIRRLAAEANDGTQHGH